MERVGISLIVVDREDKITAVLERLGLHSAISLDLLSQNYKGVEDLIFYHVMDGASPKDAEDLIHCYHVRRSVAYVGDSMRSYGRDLGWIKASVGPVKPRPVPSPQVAAVAAKALPLAFSSFPAPEDRDDPYTELGYRR